MYRTRAEIDKDSGDYPLTDSEYFCYVMGFMEGLKEKESCCFHGGQDE
jgi:hypothetical protein